MPLLLDTASFGSALDLRSANCLTIGLVNNMPDPAFEATERQFINVIRAATQNVVVRLKLFAIPDVPRTAAMRQEFAERYRDINALWETPLDGLIVTGTEPRAPQLTAEPYWATLAALVDWARDNTASTVWSCLAAHAAVLRADGVERRPLKDKLFGVFDCAFAADHPMTQHLRVPLPVPHSRHNALAERDLAACGYRILSRSDLAGVDCFARHDRSFFLFFQGHPEYEAVTLLREYRRDVGRFLKGERDNYPALPQSLFDDGATRLAEAFRDYALANRRDDVLGEFPTAGLETGLDSTWHAGAVGIYEKWIEYLRARKAEGRPLGVPQRRVWRDWPVHAARAASDRRVP